MQIGPSDAMAFTSTKFFRYCLAANMRVIICSYIETPKTMQTTRYYLLPQCTCISSPSKCCPRGAKWNPSNSLTPYRCFSHSGLHILGKSRCYPIFKPQTSFRIIGFNPISPLISLPCSNLCLFFSAGSPIATQPREDEVATCLLNWAPVS